MVIEHFLVEFALAAPAGFMFAAAGLAILTGFAAQKAFGRFR